MPYADAPSRSLQLTEAQARFDQLAVTSYDVRLDLATSAELFGSVTTIRFESTGGPTFVDLKPATVNSIVLNGRPVEVDSLDRGRLPVTTAAGTNELVVDAVMRFRNDGEGLHRSIDPADKLHYVYGMSFMDAAPSIFAVLRPTGPEGAVHLPCPGTDGLDSHRQRPRRAGRARRVGVRADPAAVDVLRDSRCRPLPRDHTTSTTASRSGSARGRASPRISTPTRTSCSR